MIEQGQQIESNTFVPRGTGKFLGTFVLFSPLLLPFQSFSSLPEAEHPPEAELWGPLVPGTIGPP